MFEKVFNDFINNYDLTDFDIRLKYNHSYRVYNLSLKYAYLLGFSKRDILIASFIGLFHDIGRFNQIVRYHNYSDGDIFDHATEGVKILFDDGLINKFDFTDKEKEIIRFSILNHNKFLMDECLDEDILKHAKLIRDVDKLDIVYLFGYLYSIDTSYEEIDSSVIDSFKNHIYTKYSGINRNFLTYFGFSFDINYDICIEEFMNNIKQFYIKNNNGCFNEIYKIIIDYLEKRKIC